MVCSHCLYIRNSKRESQLIAFNAESVYISFITVVLHNLLPEVCLTFKPEEGGMFFENLSVLSTEVNFYFKKKFPSLKQLVTSNIRRATKLKILC